jgi:hypothetical protein
MATIRVVRAKYLENQKEMAMSVLLSHRAKEGMDEKRLAEELGFTDAEMAAVKAALIADGLVEEVV